MSVYKMASTQINAMNVILCGEMVCLSIKCNHSTLEYNEMNCAFSPCDWTQFMTIWRMHSEDNANIVYLGIRWRECNEICTDIAGRLQWRRLQRNSFAASNVVDGDVNSEILRIIVSSFVLVSRNILRCTATYPAMSFSSKRILVAL